MAETISAASGTSPAPNRPQDVETVQSLLNQVPAEQGGMIWSQQLKQV
ncbi:MAG: hypothetical protein HY040_06695 [Planctomycetes bacterium]|nr:hypothetical protein [Planctomycetota bacterium]